MATVAVARHMKREEAAMRRAPFAAHMKQEEAATRRAPFAATATAFSEIEILLDKQTQIMTLARWYLQPRMLERTPMTVMELGMPGAEAHVREGLGSSGH